MFNMKLNYLGLQFINAAFFVLSYLFVRDLLGTSGPKSFGGYLILLALILAGAWAFYTIRIFYLLVKPRGTDAGDPPCQ